MCLGYQSGKKGPLTDLALGEVDRGGVRLEPGASIGLEEKGCCSHSGSRRPEAAATVKTRGRDFLELLEEGPTSKFGKRVGCQLYF